MRYLVSLVLAALFVAAALPVFARPEARSEEAVCIEIVSDSGRTFFSIPHKDSWNGRTRIIKKYLEAKKGENYGIVIHNMTPGRIGVVIAVDGRNIISGRKSDLGNNEEMYLIKDHEQVRYNGWRTARDTVHKFYFTDTAESYAMRTFEDSSAMAVISVAVYREKELPQPLYENRQSQTSQPSASAASPAKEKSKTAREESAGTGFGDEQYSPVIKVAFEPEDHPFQKTLIRYEWRQTLCRKGILACRKEARNRLWDEDSYAPYPPGYR